MTNKPDTELTLPSVVADLAGGYCSSQLMLTISFHPDPGRVGEAAILPLGRGKQHWELGRNKPEFRPRDEMSNQLAGSPIDDPGISRKALRLEYSKDSLRLNRGTSSCRCQVNGEELTHELTLNGDQLKAGVFIMLAHRVVFILREISGGDRIDAGPFVTSELRGSSPYMGRLREQILSFAHSDLDVLIRGETGTGKELVAAAIHANSARAAAKLVPVNMSAIPAALAPAALFGSAKGAFTGANAPGIGYFEQAEGGILFLDEVGDTPPEIQAQLLRALQQREIQSVGGRVRQVDLRVIAATDASLDEASDFKAALRHRLSTCEIVLQALRQHPEDIGELLWFFLHQYLTEAGKRQLLPSVTSDRIVLATWAGLFNEFTQYSWPGNVRQLSNFAHQVALASEDRLVLPPELHRQLSEKKSPPQRDEIAAASPRRSRADVSEEEFLKIMAAADYEPARASRLSGIPRTTIYRLIDSSPVLQTAGEVPEGQLAKVLSSCQGDVQRAAAQLQVSTTGLRSRIRSCAKMSRSM